MILHSTALATDLYPAITLLEREDVAVRSDLPAPAQRRVAVISASAGQDSAHAGYIGRGLLAAVVTGGVFASPSPEAVLAAIKASAGPAGALLVIRGKPGRWRNFCLAADLARQRGIPVELAFVADDVAPDRRCTIAGTVLVHKLAGAAAERGLPLSDVADIAARAAAELGSMGAGACAEAGTADEVVDTLLSTIIDDRSILAGSSVALLVNGPGDTGMEPAVVTRRAIAYLRWCGITVVRAWSGSFLPAANIAGLSLSVLPLDAQREALFDDPAAAWPGSGRIGSGSSRG